MVKVINFVIGKALVKFQEIIPMKRLISILNSLWKMNDMEMFTFEINHSVNEEEKKELQFYRNRNLEN